MTTNTKTFDLSQLTSLERGKQMVLLILFETGEVSRMWQEINQQLQVLKDMNTAASNFVIIKKMKIEKDPAGNLVGALSTETCKFQEQVELLAGMLQMWGTVLDLANAAKAQAATQAAAT